ncbi:hypothetical protein A3D00_04045 [Candidatus Woesebacteria bacterium RIFCSPHIGHO2_02_FULL_38_9]|uniref:OmpR/PhoB-type domain-containing protein n=1 Tax=Candidatus Woesebacteria bacterium RIFCSPHIGHO2_01_FULL_39_28 TaxID=1802496 RepID=A0A1F7YIV2_9BACT|nr:MAG: hypothetical protein A2627_03390 [Candidatus Woesebacteria bacterium RIFCSPHIGHO2_01_FULL_39_28]OGM34095.1 MAG: hypothetical protein A3D00_04045 [Candidatus Woesebacteria bacterium RIFCSPHIGHO2_02_FULL_38_9]OGM56975.1 MAG: hypothetical protein A3A50_03735 [Candidatus Woesebacteria bacterium RIFCSPLOWO2_01_FULL_38_20]
MGKIEDSIFENFRKAIGEGNLAQAEKAIELAKLLRSKVDFEDFIDFKTSIDSGITNIKSFFEPFPYRYYPAEGTVVIGKSGIFLSQRENKLFYFLSQNETNMKVIRIISSQDVKNHLWYGKKVTNNALKMAIRRIRLRIESDPKKPQMLINLYGKGYLFLGNNLAREEK